MREYRDHIRGDITFSIPTASINHIKNTLTETISHSWLLIICYGLENWFIKIGLILIIILSSISNYEVCTLASTVCIVMNLVDMEEVRVNHHTIMLPMKFKGREPDTERAISFYSTSRKLSAAATAKEISTQGRINTLAMNFNLNHIRKGNLHTLFNS